MVAAVAVSGVTVNDSGAPATEVLTPAAVDGLPHVVAAPGGRGSGSGEELK
jgi:hypothetical protein